MKQLKKGIILLLLGILILVPTINSFANYKFSKIFISVDNRSNNSFNSNLANFLENYFQYLLFADNTESENDNDNDNKNIDLEEEIDDYHQPLDNSFNIPSFCIINSSLLYFKEQISLSFLPETTPPPPEV